jgi:hypothetical protein
MKDVKPIETVYNGYRFRSRLEARWAVFFDALGITWEYETEGFELSDGTRYLPDFWLPTFDGGMWAEVKAEGGDFNKARQFGHDAQKNIWLCEGTPTYKAYVYLRWIQEQDFNGKECLFCLEGVGIPNADQAEDENRMYACPGYENDDNSIPPDYFNSLGNTFINAVHAARSARFEHGEAG